MNLRCDAHGRIGLTESFLRRRGGLVSQTELSTALPPSSTTDAVTAASDRLEWTAFVASTAAGSYSNGSDGPTSVSARPQPFNEDESLSYGINHRYSSVRSFARSLNRNLVGK